MFKEFKEFAMRGSVIDLLVGFTLGAAFKTVVDSVTEGLINPIIGFLTDGISLADLSVTVGKVVFKYGLVIDAFIKFIIIAFFMFMIVKGMNRLRKPAPVVVTTKICPFCHSEIPLEASRCPHCTSELPQ